LNIFEYRKLIKIFEGSLEVKLPAIWTDEKQRWEESEKRREEKRRKKLKKKGLRRKKIQARETAGKSRKTVFSNDLWLRRVEK